MRWSKKRPAQGVVGNKGWWWAKDTRFAFKRERGGAESRRCYNGWWGKRDPRLTFEQGKVVVSGLRQPRSRVRAREGGGGVWQCSPSRVRATEVVVINNKNEPTRGVHPPRCLLCSLYLDHIPSLAAAGVAFLVLVLVLLLMNVGGCVVVTFVTVLLHCHRQLELSLSSPFLVAGLDRCSFVAVVVGLFCSVAG